MSPSHLNLFCFKHWLGACQPSSINRHDVRHVRFLPEVPSGNSVQPFTYVGQRSQKSESMVLT